ncbi:hypothetical protein BsIDN1_25520 [Bacillus safensis]|uniref:Uncharacterized protein n=1 Tax=Bacillus safensis TaxID=561879 RepID=A0A5S9M9U0_BACIA|nr:hypothetical protein BsIDN1_25520 [Bacillus safensis]
MKSKSSGNLSVFDLWQSTSFKMDLSRTKQKDCPTCGTARTYPYLHDQRKKSTVLCGRDTVQIVSKDLAKLSFQHIKRAALIYM